MQLSFYKYQGTGNDFIILDNRDNSIELTNQQVKKLCDRRFGIGADGLMLLNSKNGFDFEMIYYNADGHQGSMCGNGGRCLVKFAYHQGIHKINYAFIATDGPHEATIDDKNGWINLKMKDVNNVATHFGDYILDTGSPHYVKHVNDLRNFDVVKAGREIRYNDTYKTNGINVNFVEQADDYIFVRTYERGVENETLSCGTGVTASALVNAHNDNGFNHIDIKTPGGSLAVEFDKTGVHRFENIWLCGPADLAFKGEITV